MLDHLEDLLPLHFLRFHKAEFDLISSDTFWLFISSQPFCIIDATCVFFPLSGRWLLALLCQPWPLVSSRICKH
jgi:hypothetical protein